VIVPILVALCGGVGAVARFVLDGIIRSRVAVIVPLGTLVINVSGSLLLGVLTGLLMAGVGSNSLKLVIGTGFMGGYTTFSTAMIETVRLLQQHRWVAAAVNGIGMMMLALAAAVLGLFLGSLA
jgi:CrcB protein